MTFEVFRKTIKMFYEDDTGKKKSLSYEQGVQLRISN